MKNAEKYQASFGWIMNGVRKNRVKKIIQKQIRRRKKEQRQKMLPFFIHPNWSTMKMKWNIDKTIDGYTNKNKWKKVTSWTMHQNKKKIETRKY